MSETTAKHSFPHIFSPITIGELQLPNRIIMGSMHMGMEETNPDALAEFYRVRASAGLIITGGISPNSEGRLLEHGAYITTDTSPAEHRRVTSAVHRAGGRIAMQVLHAGRYAAHPELVAPSAVRAPINRYTPREMSASDIERTIADYVQAVRFAREAGYDAVEIMGSEGYLLNQFVAAPTNQRRDEWGGSLENRCRLPLEIVRRVRAELPNFPLIYRISMLDLVPGGATADDVVWFARELAAAGISALNTGIGWHEARVPTIAAMVPRGAFTWVTKRVREALRTQQGESTTTVPLITANRINTPELAEEVLAEGDCDLVSMARPFLADPEFVAKAERGEAQHITPCIACNQACLDFTFQGREATCLVNPLAGRESIYRITPAQQPKRIAVVGGGPAGMACAATLAERGHEVTLYEASNELGGQLNYAKKAPGKEEFYPLLNYFAQRLAAAGVEQCLGTRVDGATLASSGFDEVVLATGVTPRIPSIPGIELPHVASYAEVLSGSKTAGKRVAIIGAGGIGFDVAAYLTHTATQEPDTRQDALTQFFTQWGVSRSENAPGGLTRPAPPTPAREVTLLQRKPVKPGAKLGKTTGWIHRAELAMHGVRMQGGAEYLEITPAGLKVRITETTKPSTPGEEPQQTTREELIEADTIVVCAGQESVRELRGELAAYGVSPHIIGGADVAAELDARRAIEQGTLLAARL